MTARLDAARREVHARSCLAARHPHANPCFLCPTPATVQAALEHLDSRPDDTHGALLIAHDAICHEGASCPRRDDHAVATQSERVAALRRFRRREGTG